MIPFSGQSAHRGEASAGLAEVRPHTPRARQLSAIEIFLMTRFLMSRALNGPNLLTIGPRVAVDRG
jgi:hypothetical protein